MRIAEAWREVEDDDELARIITAAPGVREGRTLEDTMEYVPDRCNSTAVLEEALALDPDNIRARCLLAANLLDSAYQREGTWDSDAVARLLAMLEQLAERRQGGPSRMEDDIALHRLGQRVMFLRGQGPEAPDVIQEWWQANRPGLLSE